MPKIRVESKRLAELVDEACEAIIEVAQTEILKRDPEATVPAVAFNIQSACMQYVSAVIQHTMSNINENLDMMEKRKLDEDKTKDRDWSDMR